MKLDNTNQPEELMESTNTCPTETITLDYHLQVQWITIQTPQPLVKECNWFTNTFDQSIAQWIQFYLKQWCQKSCVILLQVATLSLDKLISYFIINQFMYVFSLNKYIIFNIAQRSGQQYLRIRMVVMMTLLCGAKILKSTIAAISRLQRCKPIRIWRQY